MVLAAACSHNGDRSSTPSLASRANGSEDAAPCSATDLIGKGGRQGESGTAHGDLVLANVGSAACTLTGLPTVTLLASNSPLAVDQLPAEQTSTNSRVLVAGTSIDLVVSWSNWCKPDPGPLSASITLPAGGGTLTVRFDGPPDYDYVPRCDAPDGPSTVQVVGYSNI